jgi:hypothetical protein
MVGQPSSKTCLKRHIGSEQRTVTLARRQPEGQVLRSGHRIRAAAHSSYSYPYFFLGLSVYQGLGYSNAKSATWKADTRVSTRSFKGDAADCRGMTMNVIGFTTKEGKGKKFEVPRDKTFEEVEEFLKSGRSEGLKRVTVRGRTDDGHGATFA